MNDINDGFLLDDDVRFADIPPSIFKEFRLEKNDVLFNRVNSEEFVGRTGIYKYGDLKSVFASYLIRMQTKSDGDILPDYLNIFLNSAYGLKQIRKFARRAVNQANVNAEELKQIKIAILSRSIQEEIAELSNESWQEFQNSKSLYSQAEEMLLEELGLSSFAKAMEDEERFCIVDFSEIQAANRMDAEYFQPKYEKLISSIKSQNTQTLETSVKSYSTGFPFRSENYQEKGIPLIRINNIKRGSLDLSDTAYLSKRDHVLSPKDTAKPGDIVLSMSGTIGISAIIPDDIPQSSINQRILRIIPKDVERNYLVLVLNSIIGSYQLERIGTGGVQTNISYRDIRNILIPILPKETQQKIADLVRQSHESRKKAKELLEEAKHKVEEMIENQSK